MDDGTLFMVRVDSVRLTDIGRLLGYFCYFLFHFEGLKHAVQLPKFSALPLAVLGRSGSEVHIPSSALVLA